MIVNGTFKINNGTITVNMVRITAGGTYIYVVSNCATGDFSFTSQSAPAVVGTAYKPEWTSNGTHWLLQGRIALVSKGAPSAAKSMAAYGQQGSCRLPGAIANEIKGDDG